MAKSKFEYVKKFEDQATLLPNCWVVVRIDGRAFSKLTKDHNFNKPNDERGIRLMTQCALETFKSFSDVLLAYGHSDEFSFVLDKRSNLFKRRRSKIETSMVSYFSSCFVLRWSEYFSQALQYVPSFDGRAVLYPNIENLRDYLSWRQADCHINNMYNTCFWALINKLKLSATEAEAKLSGTLSADKHEIMFTQCEINYNNEPEMFRKGTVIFRATIPTDDDSGSSVKKETKKKILIEHVDIIGNAFWDKYQLLKGASISACVVHLLQ